MKKDRNRKKKREERNNCNLIERIRSKVGRRGSYDVKYRIIDRRVVTKIRYRG